MIWDINKLIKIISQRKLVDYTPMYVYTTEKVSEYYKKLNIKNKKILTIAGSGDQLINAYLLGASEVVIFDLNKLSKFITLLKITALKTLTYKEFLKFFGENIDDSTLSYTLFKKIRKKLDNETNHLFESLYSYFNYSGKHIVHSNFFHQRGYLITNIRDRNDYLKNSTNYLKARESVENKKIKFIFSDVNDLTFKIKDKFDIINLSNTPTFLVKHIYKNNPLEEFYKNIILKLNKLLNPGGVLFFYVYSLDTYPMKLLWSPSLIYLPEGINYLKAKREFFKIISFKGMSRGKDRIMCFK